MKKIICPNCQKPSLSNGMYSEDFASVFDETCKECGKHHYVYIGANDSKESWDRFRAEFKTVGAE